MRQPNPDNFFIYTTPKPWNTLTPTRKPLTVFASTLKRLGFQDLGFVVVHSTHGLFEHNLKLLALLGYVGGKLLGDVGKVCVRDDPGEYQDTVPSPADLPRGVGFRGWGSSVWCLGFRV